MLDTTGVDTAALPASRLPHLPPQARAVLWMLVSAMAFTAMMALVKFLGTAYSASLQTFYRQVAGTIVLIPFVLRYGPKAAFSTSSPLSLLLRSLLSVVGLILAFYSFQKLPLAQANTLAFTRPFWVTLLAAVVLGERAHRVQVVALIVGFAGVLMISRPAAGNLELLPALAGLVSAMLFAGVFVTLRRLTAVQNTLSLMTWSAGLGVLLSLGPALMDWRWPAGVDWLLLFAMGGLAVLNQACFVRAVRIGSPVAMAALDNIRLPLALGAGYLLFAEVPDGLTYLGMAVVAAAALTASLLPARGA